jgi:hypothetical protein
LVLQNQKQVKSVTQDIALVKHFREHLAALSDPRLLDLLALASLEPITNEDARRMLKLGRNRAWANLSDLVKLSLLEKRGHAYRASPYAENLVGALSLTFQSVLAGKMPNIRGQGWAEVLRLAFDGVETSYMKGKTQQGEYQQQMKLLKEMEAQLNAD